MRKADKYWPDEEEKIMDLGNDIKLQHRETSYQGTYFQRYAMMVCKFISMFIRTIEVLDKTGVIHTVSQLQITKWMDLTAPDDTKILLDLVNKTNELVGTKTSEWFVDCKPSWLGISFMMQMFPLLFTAVPGWVGPGHSSVCTS